MVIPMSATSDTKRSKTKRIVGDGKRIIMRTNSDSLLVIGSGNLLEIERNDGEIQIVGDGCKVCVNSGCGSIKYTGDGGFLQTGNLDLNRVTYEGDGGKIVSADGTTKRCNKKTNLKGRTYNSCDNLKSKNIYVNNQNNYSNSVPNVKNIDCVHIHIPVPKIVVFTGKCKHT